MKKLNLLILLCCMITGVSGQDFRPEFSRNNEIGIHIGATTATGLSYRHWFNRFGIQATALPVKTDETTFVSIGATALYSFYESPYMMVFGYFGNHYFLREYDEYIYYEPTGEYLPENKREVFYNLGVGPGFAFGRAVRFNLMMGYGFYDIFGKFNMFPTGEIGLYYRF